ncbi:ribosomal protein eS27-like [Alca torda]
MPSWPPAFRPPNHHRAESAGRPERLRLRGRRKRAGRGGAGRVPAAAAAMPLAKDLVHPSLEDEKRKHKKKRLVQSPNSYFMDVKCPGCYKITTVFSHAQTVVLCVGCSTVLCQPTGGKARLTEGCSFRRKQH